jgi:hypothetical protein
MAHIVVIKIGRKRNRHALRMASSGVLPARSSLSAKSTIMMPFFCTIPISRMMPMIPMTPSGMPAAFKASNAPRPAEGSVERMVMGWIQL